MPSMLAITSEVGVVKWSAHQTETMLWRCVFFFEMAQVFTSSVSLLIIYAPQEPRREGLALSHGHTRTRGDDIIDYLAQKLVTHKTQVATA